jgi:shikimate dehydrogenase
LTLPLPAQYGLIGYPLTHSFSPAYFKKKFAEKHIYALYDPFPLSDISEFPALLSAYPAMEGLNVTIPYKEAVIPYLHELDPVAQRIGAVNCIAIKNGRLKGYNTDSTGFEQSLIPLLEAQHTFALILGAGGSSKAVAYALQQLGISYQLISRSRKKGTHTYADLTPQVIARHKLIINTTPLGMYPNADAAPPIAYESIGKQHLLFDLIYNPEETKFLSLGRERGAVVKNGFEMLKLQADASWDIWSGNSEQEVE